MNEKYFHMLFFYRRFVTTKMSTIVVDRVSMTNSWRPLKNTTAYNLQLISSIVVSFERNKLLKYWLTDITRTI